MGKGDIDMVQIKYDIVGSFLRPEAIKKARAEFKSGAITREDLKKVEDEIHKLETRDGEIDGLLCDESVFSDVAKLMELNKEKEEIAGKLEVLYEKWEELAE